MDQASRCASPRAAVPAAIAVALTASLGAAPAEEVLAGLRSFYQRTARSDGSFQPGVDPGYLGMSDSAYSDLAAVTYAVTVHKTFGWKLPYEGATTAFLVSRQRPDGAFFSNAGTVDPDTAEGRTYNTTQGLVALRALGVKPRFNPLPVFEAILQDDYKTLPPYTTSFFPLAYLCAGEPIPAKADRGIRDLMTQDETGYLNDHIAATYHASHYYRLVGEETPKSQAMVARVLRDQRPDGSWLLNLPSRDRHATFDAVFTLAQEGGSREDCRAAIDRAAEWALSCRNADGGFGHYPGSTSDADAVYFQVGTLVMAGKLRPIEPLPSDPHLLSWGHLMPRGRSPAGAAHWSAPVGGWCRAVAFRDDGQRVAAASSDGSARVLDTETGRELAVLRGHRDAVAAVQFDRTGRRLATGSHDRSVAIWSEGDGALLHRLAGHRGVVLCLTFQPGGGVLASGGVDRDIRLWDAGGGSLLRELRGHRSWVSSVAFSPAGDKLYSGSSDGTVKCWSVERGDELTSVQATAAEVRAVAVSPDGRRVAAGSRYGRLHAWDTGEWKELFNVAAHPGETWSVAFAPDGETLLSAGGDWNRAGLVKRWDAASGRHVESRQHTGEVLAVAVSRDGRWIAAGGGDRSVKLWKVPAGGRAPEGRAGKR